MYRMGASDGVESVSRLGASDYRERVWVSRLVASGCVGSVRKSARDRLGYQRSKRLPILFVVALVSPLHLVSD